MELLKFFTDVTKQKNLDDILVSATQQIFKTSL